jgi:uncharacterized membrane protein
MFDLSHLHPMLVHFPIALLVVGFLADALSLFFKKEQCLSKAGLYLMVLGTLGAIAAFLTGELFTKDLAGEAGNIQETHELFASITTYTMIIASIVRIFLLITKRDLSNLKWIAFTLYGIGTLSVMITGFFGGTMVYKFLIGI